MQAREWEQSRVVFVSTNLLEFLIFLSHHLSVSFFELSDKNAGRAADTADFFDGVALTAFARSIVIRISIAPRRPPCRGDHPGG